MNSLESTNHNKIVTRSLEVLALLSNPSKVLAREKIVGRTLASCAAKIDLTQEILEERGKYRNVSLGEVADHTMNLVH